MPPHFKCEDPMTNPHICEAMQLMYGPIRTIWNGTQQDPEYLLLRVLASVVYHFDWIKVTARNGNSDHPFHSIPLMFYPKLVVELQKLVTIEPSCHIKEASGIPPHVEQSIKLQNLLELVTECFELLKSQVLDMKSVSKLFVCV